VGKRELVGPLGVRGGLNFSTEQQIMADRPTSQKTIQDSGGPGLREFIALMAALMASNAMAIDSMLPALPAIGEALGVAEENRRQLVITVYLIGFGAAQLAYGPLSDRFGRKGLLLLALILYAGFGLLAGIAASFELLLGARFLQGVAAAATRVLVVSVIRDRYAGSGMARIMSITMIVFMIVPVLAPSFGQAVLAVGSGGSGRSPWLRSERRSG
jgi:DHA1 family bicyclomycin/chloramphenicol resistance-like MFS transporter